MPKPNNQYIETGICICVFLDKKFEFRLKFHLLVPEHMILNETAFVQEVFWGRKQKTEHFLNQWWSSPPTHINVMNLKLLL